jgi:hypothetical protein
MPTATIAASVTAGGVSINKSYNRTADGVAAIEPSILAGKAGTLTTRTDNDTGVVTVASGHGITTADKITVFWSGANRYGMTVTATTSTTISIDVGAGTNLPTANTAVVISKEVAANISIDGDNTSVVAVCAEYSNASTASANHLRFLDAAGDTIAAVSLVGNVPKVWDIAGGATNDFTGDVIASVAVANGDTSAAATLKVIALVDSTP